MTANSLIPSEAPEPLLTDEAFVNARRIQGAHATAKSLSRFSTLAKQQISFLWSKDGSLRVAQPKELGGFWSAWADGSYNPATGLAAIGGILRDDLGAPKAMFSRKVAISQPSASLDASTPVEAGGLQSERRALLEALHLAADAGADRVEVKLDCLALLMRVIRCQKTHADLDMPEQSIALAMRRFEEVSLRWIPRELNTIADALSKRPTGKGRLFGDREDIQAFHLSVDPGYLNNSVIEKTAKKKIKAAWQASALKKENANPPSSIKARQPAPISALFESPALAAAKLDQLPAHRLENSLIIAQWAIGAAEAPDQGWSGACAVVNQRDELLESQWIGHSKLWAWSKSDQSGIHGARLAIKNAFKKSLYRNSSLLTQTNAGSIRLSADLYRRLEEADILKRALQSLVDMARAINPLFSLSFVSDEALAPTIERAAIRKITPESNALQNNENERLAPPAPAGLSERILAPMSSPSVIPALIERREALMAGNQLSAIIAPACPGA